MPESSHPVVVEVPLFDFDDERLDAAAPAPVVPSPAAPAPVVGTATSQAVNGDARVGSLVVLERDPVEALDADDTIVIDVDAAAVLETGRAAVLEDLEEAVRAAPEPDLVVDTEITLPLVPAPPGPTGWRSSTWRPPASMSRPVAW